MAAKRNSPIACRYENLVLLQELFDLPRFQVPFLIQVDKEYKDHREWAQNTWLYGFLQTNHASLKFYEDNLDKKF